MRRIGVASITLLLCMRMNGLNRMSVSILPRSHDTAPMDLRRVVLARGREAGRQLANVVNALQAFHHVDGLIGL